MHCVGGQRGAPLFRNIVCIVSVVLHVHASLLEMKFFSETFPSRGKMPYMVISSFINYVTDKADCQVSNLMFKNMKLLTS